MTQSEDVILDEDKAVNDLRRRLKNELPSKMYDNKLTLKKFLIARNFNIDQAEVMLRKHLEFRKQVQLDYLVQDYKPIDIFHKYMPQNFVGFDKEGCIIRYCPLGNIDGRGLFKCANAPDVCKTVVQCMQADLERMEFLSKKTGKTVSKCVYIYNLEHMTLAKATHKKSIEYYLHGLTVFQDNFPEFLKSVFIINASIYFTMVFALVQKILTGTVLSKIQVYGQDGWKDKLLESIDADVLPAFLGGTRTDPDGNPLCNTFIEHAGMIPEKFYLKKNPQNLLNKPEAQVVTIPAQSDVQITVHVKNPKSVLKWEYESSKNDICFGLQYAEFEDSETVDLIPLHKIETNLAPECGVYRCQKAGNYIFVFDNSYSWFNSKQVYYLINVVNAEEFIQN